MYMSGTVSMVGLRKKVSLTGIEPVTDGFQISYYSPPLYQLSYTELVFSQSYFHYLLAL
jgi:hypothetical protein